MKKFWMILFASMIFFAGCSTEPPVEVTVGRVLLGDEDLILKHEGNLTLSNEMKILAEVSGNVMEKYFDNGTDVEEGQPLYKTDGMGSYSDLLQARVELTKAMTDLAREEASENKSNVAALQAEIADRQAQIKALEAEAEGGMIYAPKSGRIGADSVGLGAEVIENETILTTIGNINPLAVRFEVSETEKNILMRSNPLVTLKFSDGTTYDKKGTLKFPADKSTVEANFDNSDGLLSVGMAVQIEISGLNVPDLLLVSKNVVQHHDGEDFVFLEEDNKAVLKKVSLGDKLGDYYIVKDNLKVCDGIVIAGFEKLHDGTPLKATYTVNCGD